MAINGFQLLILISIVGIQSTLFFQVAKKGIERLYFVCSTVGIIVYSGISTIYEDFCQEYFIAFLIFYCVFSCSMLLGMKIQFGAPRISRKALKPSTAFLTDKFLIICCIGFYSYYFVQLIYPEVRLGDLFNISLSIKNIFERRAAQRSAGILQLFYYVNLATTAFFFIFCYRLSRRHKMGTVIAMLLFWYYLRTIALGYISRNEILVAVAFILLLLDNRGRETFRLSFRFFLMLIGLVLISIPFLLAYESTRLGATAENLDYISSFSQLVTKETNYGQYYDVCVEISEPDLIGKYFIWFFTLPLPSAIFGFIKNLGLQVNTYFTVTVTGVSTSASNYSVILPSFFGEALMIYGPALFVMHGIFVGFLIGLLCRLIGKNPELNILNIYFGVQLLTLGRGGSQGDLANMVNYLLIYCILLFVVRRVYGYLGRIDS